MIGKIQPLQSHLEVDWNVLRTADLTRNSPHLTLKGLWHQMGNNKVVHHSKALSLNGISHLKTHLKIISTGKRNGKIQLLLSHQQEVWNVLKIVAPLTKDPHLTLKVGDLTTSLPWFKRHLWLHRCQNLSLMNSNQLKIRSKSLTHFQKLDLTTASIQMKSQGNTMLSLNGLEVSEIWSSRKFREKLEKEWEIWNAKNGFQLLVFKSIPDTYTS
jgi:hypothetical protein